MGWTGINTNKSIEQVYENEFIEWRINQKIIKSAFIQVPGNKKNDPESIEQEQYLAVRTDDGTIVCVVILWKQYDGEVLYKVMDESMGPYTKTKAPKDVLQTLSPLSKLKHPGYAKEFRERMGLIETNQIEMQL